MLFKHRHKQLDGKILDHKGVCIRDNGVGYLVGTCSDCYASLIKYMMPKYALANLLYIGELPEDLKDITWVEEMVCCLYRPMANIVRIFKSNKPVAPTKLFGNTCAHEMNIISTAKVLPRTPADVNGSLSVVFVGRLSEEKKIRISKYMFRVRKSKVWRFLLWLKKNNRLYADIPIDESIMNMYDCGYIPDIENHIIDSGVLNSDEVFAEETAGIAEHPADLLHESNVDNTCDSGVGEDDEQYDVSFMERTGVSDPEGVTLSGRSLTASAVHKLFLLPENMRLPDIVISRSYQAQNEYNNPTLIPGMFPTLFPYGGGVP